MTRRRAEGGAKANGDSPREAIRTAELLQRLEDHALGRAEMSSTEVRAAEILLKKRLPDLSTVAMTARAGTLEEMLETLESGGAQGAGKA
ncbi:MAG TPA: hypothetical protein VJ798_02150 [Rhizomicrobium sp.]|nr:hypothetical protein [Rhizomicrobium sp.]